MNVGILFHTLSKEQMSTDGFCPDSVIGIEGRCITVCAIFYIHKRAQILQYNYATIVLW